MITPQKFAFSLCFPSWLYYFNTCSEFATSFFHLTTIGMESVELPSEWGIKKDQVKWIVNRGTCVGWPSYGSTDTVSCRGIFLALSLLCAVFCYSTTVSCTIHYCPVVCRSPVHSYLFEFFFCPLIHYYTTNDNYVLFQSCRRRAHSCCLICHVWLPYRHVVINCGK